MVKDNETVIKEFNTLINMTPSDLETWLESPDSTSSGWAKEDGSGETIGHDSYSSPYPSTYPNSNLNILIFAWQWT
ncbi:hypothetical protein LHYA1_G007262 [Lachnellula hyalina]|uniref:Uncharacterized protein n=1 Tax=Lachnellula hyalina TaxID=1316788 RepID=A0A8H8TYH3_9HELO|nr:uncharacterized protein LHYA1_G007262 [Lachnellula hyalina]TVY23921.1 hypothetical protein LHYA1_G007262 [Lachnellula hyalina]